MLRNKKLTIVLAISCLLTLFANGPTLSSDSDKEQAQANFMQADGNGDNQLTLNEFTVFINLNAEAGIGKASQIRSSEAYSKAFVRLDTNKNGVLSVEEIQKASNASDVKKEQVQTNATSTDQNNAALNASVAKTAMPAVARTNVNLRAGPATSYPVIRVVPKGAKLVAVGCLADHSWCDVRFAGDRGWLAASYIVLANGAVVTPAARLRVVNFNQAYWRKYYRAYPWYSRWGHYYRRPVGRPAVRTGCVVAGCSGSRTVTGPAGRTFQRSISVNP